MCSNRIKFPITVYKPTIKEDNSKQSTWGQAIEMLSTGKKTFEYGSHCTSSKLLCQRCNVNAQECLLKLSILALLTRYIKLQDLKETQCT